MSSITRSPLHQTTRFIAAAALAASFAASAACGKEAPEPAAAPVPVSIAADAVATAAITEMQTGPRLSGQLAPAREATARAEVGGSITSLNVEEGRAVSRGAAVGRIEARDLQAAVSSGDIGVRSADTALKIAGTEAARVASLVKGGAMAQRDLDMANSAVASASAQLAAAQARLTSARQQISDTVLRAPIAGVVSVKTANTGDVVAPGTPLFTVIDPTSMRLEASVTSDELATLRVGAPVEFQVRGYPQQTFTGRVERISPAADPVTRQVSIFVTIPNAGGRLIGGLFAEGRVNTQAHRALIVPASALDETGPSPTVSRVRDNKVERVPVTIGLRDNEREVVEIKSGLSEGDRVLIGAVRSMAAGTLVQVK
ncbi:MAG: efflux RND transporter periplasmic adaptor subunit [Acidobacteriota bacterium]|nr:efflux RND transporter periplasmic adaptor subunit [Acidobacteriota bacterium]